jgi:hypothetical protein
VAIKHLRDLPPNECQLSALKRLIEQQQSIVMNVSDVGDDIEGVLDGLYALYRMPSRKSKVENVR